MLLNLPCLGFVIFCLDPRVISYGCFCVQLLSTADDVSKMQEELETMRPQLEEAARDTVVTMDKIKAI